MKNHKYHTVGTVPKYHPQNGSKIPHSEQFQNTTFETVPKYHTVRTVPKYHTRNSSKISHFQNSSKIPHSEQFQNPIQKS